MVWSGPSGRCTRNAADYDKRLCQTENVPEFCTCGAQLPPDARFCHKCGKPQYDYPGVEQSETPPPLIEVASVPPAPPVQVSGEISFHNRLAVRVGLISAVAAVLVSVVPLPFIFLRFLAY